MYKCQIVLCPHAREIILGIILWERGRRQKYLKWTQIFLFLFVTFFPTKMLKYLNNVGNIFHATLTLN